MSFADKYNGKQKTALESKFGVAVDRETAAAAAVALKAKQRKKAQALKGNRAGSQTMLHLGGVAAGGELTNRPPAISKGGKGHDSSATPSEFAGGEDWFEGSLWVEWERWDTLHATLEAARESAKAEQMGDDGDRQNVVTAVLGDFFVHASGAASSGKGPQYRYRLQKQGVTFLIARMAEPCAEFANVRFVVGSLALMLQDAEVVWAQIQADLDELGGKITRSTLSRVDVCVDLPGIGVDVFEERWRAGRFITRARESVEYSDDDAASLHYTGRGDSRRCTGFTIGAAGAPIKLNVYDKLHEVTKKRDDDKLKALVKYRWNGEIPACATRVEVQMRREKIKEFTYQRQDKNGRPMVKDGKPVMQAVDSVDDWFKARAEVMRYLWTQWLRFTETDVDRRQNHYDKAPTWDLWKRLVSSIETVFGGAARTLDRVRSIRVDFNQLDAQSFGTLSSAVTYAQGVIQDKATFVSALWAQMMKVVEAKPWSEVLRRNMKKRTAFDAAHPTQCFGDAPDVTFARFWNREAVVVPAAR